MVIGQYRIIEKIGEGGMGVIYKAEHCTLEQIVAIKSLPGTLNVNSDLRERFIREAKIQAKLSHSNVVNIHNFFEFEGNHYIVMEYVEGETLESLIKTKGLLPPDSCIAMFKQILAGIGYAHEMGIIHRDVKPSNIIIKKDGTVKITDFGIAKIAGDLQKTQTGVKVGTLWYMSPEQVKGQSAGIASDIYSLGVTLFEMITGKVPFAGNSEYNIMKNIVECSPPSPREFYPYVPIPLEKIILKAIAKEPEDRFRSVADFDAALNNPEDITPSPVIPQDADGMQKPAGMLNRWRGHIVGLSVAVTLGMAFFIFSKAKKGETVVVSPPPAVTPKTLDVKPNGGITRKDLEARRVKELSANLENQRKTIRTYLTSAHSSHQKGNYGKAIEMYKKVLAINPGNNEANKGIEDARTAWSAEKLLGTLK